MAYARLPATILAALGLALGPAALAVAAEPDGVQLAQSQQFSDEQLESFAVAALEVQQIRQDYTARIQQAESEDQRKQLVEKANSEMAGAVERAPGISIEDYNAIIEAASADPQLSKRIQKIVESTGGSTGQ